MKHELKKTEIMEKEGLPLRDPSTWNGRGFDKNPIKNAHDNAEAEGATNPSSFPNYNPITDINNNFLDDPNNY